MVIAKQRLLVYRVHVVDAYRFLLIDTEGIRSWLDHEVQWLDFPTVYSEQTSTLGFQQQAQSGAAETTLHFLMPWVKFTNN